MTFVTFTCKRPVKRHELTRTVHSCLLFYKRVAMLPASNLICVSSYVPVLQQTILLLPGLLRLLVRLLT